MNPNQPLAERMRPKSLEEYIGQQHLVGSGKILRQLLENKISHSMIFWGPPGVGKTTLAQIIASTLDLPFFGLSAIEAGVKEIRQVIDLAQKAGKALLFIDEIHRFNKSQQDSLLAAVEKGILILIGATTENPSFEVNSALLSRTQVYNLEPFSAEELKALVLQAQDKDSWLHSCQIKIQEWDALLRLSGGDGRRILNLVERLAQYLPPHSIIDNKIVTQIVQDKLPDYDKAGEQHYDIISAFIKSIRGSDPNAALYYLARMIAGGEDPKFIARRLLILASEDIGNANPNALLLANACFQAVSVLGYPECRITLAQTTTFLASSAKSNAAYLGINNAQTLVQKTGDLPIPLSLRNAPTRLMQDIGYGDGYLYAHDFENGFVPMEFLPESIKGTCLYPAKDIAHESKLKAYLRQCWQDKYGY